MKYFREVPRAGAAGFQPETGAQIHVSCPVRAEVVTVVRGAQVMPLQQ